MLQNADDIRIARVLVNPVKGTMSQCLVLAADVRFVHSNFDLLHRVVGQVGQGHVGLVEEFRQHILV